MTDFAGTWFTSFGPMTLRKAWRLIVTERLSHRNVVSSHAGTDMAGNNSLVVFTDLPTDPANPHFDSAAFESLRAAIQAYLEAHPEYDHATIVPR